jgi:acyl-CoA thioester hydrolase
MFSHEIEFRVRYAETDQMGYVYYGNYPQYFEVGRVEALRSIGVAYKNMESVLGVMMPVKSLNIKYLRPIFYDELITLKTTISKMPDTEIEFNVEIFNEVGKLATTGTVILAFVDIEVKKSVKIPESLVLILSPFFKNSHV